MQITLKIDGKNKVFKQDKVNFKTIHMAIRWMKRFEDQKKMLAEVLQGNIDEGFDLSEHTDPFEDLEFTAELIVNFFDNQFTYDDLFNGLYINDIRELYGWAEKIFENIQGNYEKKTNKTVIPLKK